MAQAVVALADASVRARVANVLASSGFLVSVFARPREWPFLGQIVSGRCWRIGQCGAQALVVDDEPDEFACGADVVAQQLRQGCRCADTPARAAGKLVLLTDPHGPLAQRLRARGVAVTGREPADIFLRHWVSGVIRRPWHEAAPEVTPTTARVLFMRCPYTGQIVPADALKRLQDHFASLGHVLSPRQVVRIRDKHWCDAEGRPVQLDDVELERLRLTVE